MPNIPRVKNVAVAGIDFQRIVVSETTISFHLHQFLPGQGSVGTIASGYLQPAGDALQENPSDKVVRDPSG
jgi:hypothetical protein